MIITNFTNSPIRAYLLPSKIDVKIKTFKRITIAYNNIIKFSNELITVNK